MFYSRKSFLRTLAGGVTGVAAGGILGAAGCRSDTATPVTLAATTPAEGPAYLRLHHSGELKKRGERLWAMLNNCRLCPRRCGVDRLGGRRGVCRATARLEIASHQSHFGEERPLVGPGGSGAIFLSHCALRCVFCINWKISHEGEGRPHAVEDMAGMMLDLQRRGCANINMVTPTHYAPHILLALDLAAAQGLRLPLVYNTCGWENMEILRMLDGVVDIYLPDFKYADPEMAARYSAGAHDYPAVLRQVLPEMQRQVGTARPEADGLIRRGLMVRHLVMPNNVGGSCEVVRWLAGNLPKDTYLNIMSQYQPMYRAHAYPAISRRITREEYAQVVETARAAGLTNLDVQGI